MGVLHNVENQNRLTAFQREKRLLSAKAMLPAALVGLTEIADEALETIRQVDNQESGSRSQVGGLSNRFLISAEITLIIREVIEYTEDPRAARRLAGLITEHQVFQSRLVGTATDQRVNEVELNERYAEWAAWYCLVTTTFPYARSDNQTIDVDVTKEMVINRLSLCGLAVHAPSRLQGYAALYARSFKRKGY